MTFKLKSSIRFPEKGIGIHMACPVWEPQRKIFGGVDSERWLSPLWVRTESSPCCAGHTVLLKMVWFKLVKPCSSPPVVTADPIPLSASAQEFSLLCLTNTLLVSSAVRNILSNLISCYAFFVSCHQQTCTLPFHRVCATSLCSTPLNDCRSLPDSHKKAQWHSDHVNYILCLSCVTMYFTGMWSIWSAESHFVPCQLIEILSSTSVGSSGLKLV